MGNRGSWLRGIALGVVILCAMWALPWPKSSPLLAAAHLPSQSTPDWELAAGGRMAFDSASIVQNTTAPRGAVFSNFPLGPGDVYIPNGGIFRARNFPLANYIFFAYKITPNQEQFILSQLPQWAITDRFDIQARAEGNPSKDQMRLMIQALLADRFKLAVHRESRQVPVMALVVDPSGTAGTLLQKHPEDSPCPTTPFVPSPPPTAPPQAFDNRFPDTCGGILGMTPSAPGLVRVGARNVPMALIANSMTGGSTGVDLPVVDKTNLAGRFDFAVEFAPQDSKPASANPRPDSSGPSFAEALKDQLGLRLEAQTSPVDFLVLDHIEPPSLN